MKPRGCSGKVLGRHDKDRGQREKLCLRSDKEKKDHGKDVKGGQQESGRRRVGAWGQQKAGERKRAKKAGACG